MTYRKSIETQDELTHWYNLKYEEMRGTWFTPPEDAEKHLNDLGVPFDQTKTLLDIGCGGGHFLEQARRRVRCVGIDPSPVAIQYAKQQLGEVAPGELICCTLGEMASYPEKFDYIVSIGSIEHIPDLEADLKVVAKLLKPPLKGGLWYFYVPNQKWLHQDQPNERTMDTDAWGQFLESCGLRVLETQEWNDNTAITGSL